MSKEELEQDVNSIIKHVLEIESTYFISEYYLQDRIEENIKPEEDE